MHENEFNIDEKLVTNLIQNQYPEFAEFSIKKLKHYGADNAIFRLGKDYAIRFPRTDDTTNQILKEQKWLPIFKNYLPIKISEIIKTGKPSEGFPHPWYIYSWIDGENAYNEELSDLNHTAIELANFVKKLWTIETNNAPHAYRGGPLKNQDKVVQKYITDLKNMFDINIIQHIWQDCLRTPSWNKNPVWLHGDLLPPNILVKNGKLRAIIDFGLTGIGDPACDLIPAWCLFDEESRNIFKQSLQIDENTWIRAKGWALSIAVIIIPYYIETNKVLVSVSKNIINNIIDDYKKYN